MIKNKADERTRLMKDDDDDDDDDDNDDNDDQGRR